MENDEKLLQSTALPEDAKKMLREIKGILKEDKDSVDLNDLLGEPLRITLLNLNKVLTEHVIASGMPPEIMNKDLKAINCITQGGMLLGEGIHEMSPVILDALIPAVVGSLKDLMMHLSSNPKFGELMSQYMDNVMSSAVASDRLDRAQY